MRALATRHAPSLELLLCHRGLAGRYVLGSGLRVRGTVSGRVQYQGRGVSSEPEALSPRSSEWSPSLSGLAESSHLSVVSSGGAENSLDLTTGEFSTAGAELRAKHN